MSLLKAIILGFVQGVTEFLPISSSGHLSLFQHFLGVNGEGSLLFSVLLHLGTLIAVFVVFNKTIFELIKEAISLLKDIFTGKFKFSALEGKKKILLMFVFSCIPLLFLLFPVGNDMKLMDYLSQFSEDNSILLEGFCFLFTGVLLFVSTYISNNKKLNKKIDAPQAFAIGIAQAIAAGFPGVSRSGSTISTGMICGVSKSDMVEYSFILGIPAIIVANIVELKGAIEMNSEVDFVPTVAGVIVAIIALPLSIALAIASGVSPEKGIYTAIVAGFVIAFLGGSNVNISGPTAAFATIVAGIVAQFGTSGLVIATLMAGLILIFMGVFRFGSLIKYIPHTITTGVTSGIALTIVIGQIKDFLGLTFPEGMPTVETIEKVEAIIHSIATFNWQALLMGAIALAILIVWPKISKKIPGSLIAVVVGVVIVKVTGMDVNTVGDLYSISRALPEFSLPAFSF